MTYNEFIKGIIDMRGQWNIPSGEYYESHHIIPICLNGKPKYRNKRLKHDNLIWLYPEEHFIAHKLLALENPENSDLFYAWHRMAFPLKNQLEPIYPEDYKLLRELTSLKNKEKWKTATNDELIEFSNKVSSSLKEYFKYETEEHKATRVNKWKETWYNKSEEELNEISFKHSQSSLAYWNSLSDEDYNNVCKKRKEAMTGEVKLKILKSMSGDHNPAKKAENRKKISNKLLDRTYYNNGIKNKRIKNGDHIPEGYVLGKLPTGISNNEGKIWVNNGIKSKMVFENAIPDGFKKGRLSKNDNK